MNSPSIFVEAFSAKIVKSISVTKALVILEHDGILFQKFQTFCIYALKRFVWAFGSSCEFDSFFLEIH